MYSRVGRQSLLYAEVCATLLMNDHTDNYRYERLASHRVRNPRGYDKLPNNITLTDVVRSSVAWQYAFGLGGDEVTPENQDAFYGGLLTEKLGGRLDSLWNIPIAVCNGGECISNDISDVEPGTKNLPCIVGEEISSWWPPNNPSDQEYMKVSYCRANSMFCVANRLASNMDSLMLLVSTMTTNTSSGVIIKLIVNCMMDLGQNSPVSQNRPRPARRIDHGLDVSIIGEMVESKRHIDVACQQGGKTTYGAPS